MYITDHFLKIGFGKVGAHLENLALELEELSEGTRPPGAHVTTNSYFTNWSELGLASFKMLFPMATLPV